MSGFLEHVLFYDASAYQKKSITMNLVRGQKLLSKLKKHIDKTDEVEESDFIKSITRSSVANHKTAEENMATLVGFMEETKKRYVSEHVITNDYTELKNEIYKKNTVIGVADVLSQVEQLTELKRFYERLLGSFKGTTVEILKQEHIERMVEYNQKEKTERLAQLSRSNGYMDSSLGIPSLGMAYSPVEKTVLEEKIKGVNRALEDLETRRDYLNASNQITVELSTVSCDILGL
jgi:metal-responsive CopG/Arc/MetJ family transcriptional regulator